MQSYGVRCTHAESENKFNVKVQLKASKAATTALESRWEWSRLPPSRRFSQTGGKFGSFSCPKQWLAHPHLSDFTQSFRYLLPAPTSHLSIPPFVAVDLNVLLGLILWCIQCISHLVFTGSTTGALHTAQILHNSSGIHCWSEAEVVSVSAGLTFCFLFLHYIPACPPRWLILTHLGGYWAKCDTFTVRFIKKWSNSCQWIIMILILFSFCQKMHPDKRQCCSASAALMSPGAGGRLSLAGSLREGQR